MSTSHPVDNEPDLARRTREARDKLQDQVHDLEQTYDDARAQLEAFNDTAVAFIKENPGLCIVGAVAAGFIIGRLASRRWLV